MVSKYSGTFLSTSEEGSSKGICIESSIKFWWFLFLIKCLLIFPRNAFQSSRQYLFKIWIFLILVILKLSAVSSSYHTCQTLFKKENLAIFWPKSQKLLKIKAHKRNVCWWAFWKRLFWSYICFFLYVFSWWHDLKSGSFW